MNQVQRLGIAAALCGVVAQANEAPELMQRARVLVEQNPLIDMHVDVPYRIREEWVDVTGATDGGQFDYPRAVKGGLNIPFMSIYTPAELDNPARSRQLAHELIDSVEAMVARAPERFMMVRSVGDVEKAVGAGKIGLALGMENGSPINNDLQNISRFAARGIRYITLAHSRSNDISDSSFDPERQWNGLSDFGREVVREMNRAGVMVDISHVSDEAFWQVLEISEVPVIASHSSVRKFTPGFERNMDDEMIKALAANGGVMMINFGSAFLNPRVNEILTRFRAERKAYLEKHAFAYDGPEAKAFSKEFMSKHPDRFAELSEVADHFDHVIGLVGADHVGIGSDFDGVGDTLPVGLKDVSAYPSLVAEFLRRGYSEEDIAKILGGNLLRVWREVEAYASQ